MAQKGIGVFFSDESQGDPWVLQAYEEIKYNWGATCRIGQRSMIKYGKNADVDTSRETVWLPGGDETYVASDLITTISSSDSGDGQVVNITGFTLSGSDFTEVSQNATLNGQNKVTLTTPLARCVRMFNSGATDLAGTVYAYEDDTITNGVPDTATKIHAQMDGTDNQTLQCATTMPSNDYWAIGQVFCGINNKTAAGVEFSVQVREFGKVFRTQLALSAHPEGGAVDVQLRPFLIVPANADFRITATSDTANISVTAWASGPILEVQ